MTSEIEDSAARVRPEDIEHRGFGADPALHGG